MQNVRNAVADGGYRYIPFISLPGTKGGASNPSSANGDPELKPGRKEL